MIEAFCCCCGSPLKWVEMQPDVGFRTGVCTFVDCRREWTFFIENTGQTTSSGKKLIVVEGDGKSVAYEPYQTAITSFIEGRMEEYGIR